MYFVYTRLMCVCVCPPPRADTSLTNFFAFLLGSQSALPAVEYFCLYASISILFDFFLQVTAETRDDAHSSQAVRERSRRHASNSKVKGRDRNVQYYFFTIG